MPSLSMSGHVYQLVLCIGTRSLVQVIDVVGKSFPLRFSPLRIKDGIAWICGVQEPKAILLLLRLSMLSGIV
jgi:hypothetical protein